MTQHQPNPKRRSWGLIPVLVAALLLAACGDDRRDSADDDDRGSDETTEEALGPDTSGCPGNDSQGITDTEVVLGTSAPLSGPGAAQANVWAGVDAYFQYVNSQGGIQMQDGKTRTIRYEVLDDQLQPSRTKANVDELVNQTGVFALVSVFGTAPNAAILTDVDRFCVPNAFAQTGAIDASGPQHPWTMVAIPPYQIEARVLAEHLLAQDPDATVAILSQNDDLGRSAVEGFKAAVEGTDVEIVAEETYETTDPDVAAQMTTLINSRADVFFNASFGAKCLQAFNDAQANGWQPLVLAMFTCGGSNALSQANPGATDGAIQAHYLKDFTEAKAAGDPGIALYEEWIAKTPGRDNPTPALGGWAIGQYVVQALEAMPVPSRSAFLGTAQNMSFESDMIYDGIALETSVADDGDYFIVEGWRIDRFDQDTATFEPIETIDLNGQNPVE